MVASPKFLGLVAFSILGSLMGVLPRFAAGALSVRFLDRAALASRIRSASGLIIVLLVDWSFVCLEDLSIPGDFSGFDSEGLVKEGVVLGEKSRVSISSKESESIRPLLDRTGVPLSFVEICVSVGKSNFSTSDGRGKSRGSLETNCQMSSLEREAASFNAR